MTQSALFRNLTFYSLLVLAVGIFTSVSFSAISHILLFIASAGYLLTNKIDYKELPLSAKALIGLMIAITASVISNSSIIEVPFKNIFKIKYFLIPLLGIFPAYSLAKKISKNQIRLILNTLLLASLIASLSGLVGLYTGFNPIKFKDACHSTRACGLYGMYMTYGYGISLLSSLIIGIIFYQKRFKGFVNLPLLYISCFVNIIGLALSYSRGAWIGFALSIPFLFYRRKGFFKILIFTILLGGVSILSIPKIKDTFFNKNRIESNRGRIAFYQTAVKAFLEKPLLGYGHRNFEPNVKKLKEKYDLPLKHFGGHAHNNLLESLASTGAIGFLFCLAFFLLWLKEVICYCPPAVPFVINFLVSGLFQYTFGDGENLFLIMGVWMITSLFIVMKKRGEKLLV